MKLLNITVRLSNQHVELCLLRRLLRNGEIAQDLDFRLELH